MLPCARPGRFRLLALVPALCALGACDGVSDGDPTGSSTTVTAAASDDAASSSAAPDADEAETSSPPEPDAAESISDDDAVAMAQRLSAALEQDDEEEWASLFEVDEEKEEEIRRWFRSVRSVPMDERAMVAELVLARDTAEGTAVQMGFVHQITDGDVLAGVESYRVSLDREPGEDPVVVGWRGQNSTDGYPQLWDLADIQVHEVPGALVLAPADRDVQAVLPGVSQGALNALEDFGGDDDGSRLVVALVDDEQLAAIHESSGAGTPAGLVQIIPGAQSADPSALGFEQEGWAERINISLDAVEADAAVGSPPGGFDLVRHEALHALVDDEAQVTSSPMWVSEGFATWYGVRRDYDLSAAIRDEVAQDGLPEALPGEDDFASDEQVEGAYVLGSSVFLFMEERLGFDVTRDVGVALSTMEWRRRGDVDETLVELTGWTLDQLQEEWLTWVPGRYGG